MNAPLNHRDVQLDLFRGLAMMIILVAHIPSNAWAEWIPARFGFSDATEIFVFCSGVASAHAYGRVFDRKGLAAGVRKVLARLRLVYAAHVGVFATVTGTMAVAATSGLGDGLLRDRLGLGAFVDDPVGRTAQFLALAYVPNGFDILPMYLVVLALIPAMLVLARYRLAVAAMCSVALWALAGAGVLQLTADMQTGRVWFFNPFGWQLLFFLGFAFGSGRLPVPGISLFRLVLAVTLIAAAAPVSCHAGWSCHSGWGAAPALGEIQAALLPYIDKASLGPLRILHFLALAYLAHTLVARSMPGLGSIGGRTLQLVGRQTLAAFLVGLWLAQVLGLLLDAVGREMATTAFANVLGVALLVAAAAIVEAVKRSRRLTGSLRPTSLIPSPVPEPARRSP